MLYIEIYLYTFIKYPNDILKNTLIIFQKYQETHLKNKLI